MWRLVRGSHLNLTTSACQQVHSLGWLIKPWQMDSLLPMLLEHLRVGVQVQVLSNQGTVVEILWHGTMPYTMLDRNR